MRHVWPAVAGSTGNGGAQPLPSVSGRRVKISRELLVYLAEPDQIDVDGLTFWGFGVCGALTAHARRLARSRLQRKCRI